MPDYLLTNAVPPPPSDPATPNDMGPGTPNSTTTSLSALSVVAIKDGAMGHGGRGGHGASANTLEAERADRISRLAGLERVATARNPGGHLAPGAQAHPPPGYFDNTPQIKERSTVGSASATGSVGGRTTWASGSIDYDADKMSEDPDDGVSSVGGMSDEDKASLVGFGEGAGSTVSGPISTTSARAMAARGFASPSTPRTNPPYSGSGQSTPMSGIVPSNAAGSMDPKMMDGMSYDANIVDTTMQPAPPVGQQQQHSGNRFSGVGAEMAEGIMRDRLDDSDSNRRPMGTPEQSGQGLGKFSFEKE
jgi:hypothetical protein